MIKNKQTRRTIAIFFLLNFLTTMLPYNALYANNNGPNVPEAAAFEPVDATDMVNLVTGNLSYVLPLLNVPSPEGGYPLALSYHSGIAVDQEASWVGLGWNLNPGAINRGLNGYPDDWGKTNVSEFFYDKGWSDDYYSFSAGVTFNGSVSVGLGLSWGSNQSLGGYVSASVGLGGEKGASIGGYVGTNGVGITGGVGGFNGSLGTDGVGIGYGTGGNVSVGFNLNYNYNSGLSGGISVTQSKRDNEGKLLHGKSSGIGMSFSSKGVSVNGKVNGIGAGVSSSVGNVSNGDYNVAVASNGFFIPLYIFYIGYNHTNVKYSLFKYDVLETSGIIYPVDVYRDEVERFPVDLDNHFMDVNIIQPFKKNSLYNDLIEEVRKNDKNNLMLPNYDNYIVNAQGISGNITPYYYEDLILSGRGSGKQNNESMNYLNYSYDDYLNGSVSEYDGRKVTEKAHFTFSNAYNSFLRNQKANLPVGVLAPLDEVNEFNVLNKFKYQTDFSTNFDNSNSIINSKKREGNSIITYTNKEIRQGGLSGFIEAKEGSVNLNRQDTDVFLDDGVGAFKITALDGKTYHYSLPVYQFESVYKNFKKVNGRGDDVATENDNFLEILKTTPYATHWLLTAITGPDYVDTNIDGKPDKGDYGYWVEFDYGKWSDGYIWRTPSGRVEENIDVKNPNNTNYSYTWGRKQIYYLDAIRTRTHTALFVKSERNDDKSNSKTAYIKKITGDYWGQYNEFCKTYSSVDSNDPITVKEAFEYFDIKSHYSLCLDKIILLEDSGFIDKSKKNVPILTNGLIKGALKKIDWKRHYHNNEYTVFETQLGQNILDVKDIEGLGLEEKASQVIEFEYDNSLVSGAPNSSSGRLTLKKLHMKGKGGVQLIPPYEFSYGANYSYNKDKIDAWGYNEYNAAAWSLNKITTPTGGEIKINYESDVTRTAVDNYLEFETGFSYYTQTKTFELSELYGGNLELKIDPSIEFDYELKIGDKVDVDYTRVKCNYAGASTLEKYLGPGTIIDKINQREYIVKIDGSETSEISSPCISLDGSAPSGSFKGIVTYYYKDERQEGGIRTKSITINDGVKDIATTEYIYRNGMTSYAPFKIPQGVPYVSELPAPTVMYGEVEVQNKDGKGDYLGKTVFDFETLKSRQNESGYIFSLGENFRVKENQNTTFESGKVIANKYTIESKLGNIGRINGIKKYNSKGQLLSQTKNRYKTELDGDGEIGVTQETHSSYKRVKKSGVEKFYVSSTSKVDYPSVLESVEETTGGLTVTKHFDHHDFLTGQVLETRTYTSDGKAFKTKTVPAYTKYSKMGSKVDDITNKNMLTQEAANYSYVLKDNEWKPVGVGITTWNNVWGYTFNNNSTGSTNEVWRKHKTYTWKGAKNEDGTLDFTEADGSVDFNWGIGSAQTTNWQETSNVTRYNQFSQPLEVKDINGNYAATKMGDNYSKVIATSNAGYDEMHYSGAEYLSSENASYFDGGISSQGYTADKAHTGKYSVKVTSGVQGYLLTMRNSKYRPGKYKVSVWVDKANYGNIRINDGSLKAFNGEKVFAGEWVLMTHYFDLTTGDKNIYVTVSSGTSYIDDFRLHPVGSSMMSYVYNEWDEVSYITGVNGLSTHYIYDAAGRLIETQVETVTNVAAGIEGGFKRVSENTYNYKK